MMRHWAGIVDITPDRSPLMGLTDVKGLYLDGGWGTGGFKATPGAGDLMADTVANDKAHPLVKPFGLDRFTSGRLVDEGAASGVH
jgi:sarcosine oxidase subunit beta